MPADLHDTDQSHLTPPQPKGASDARLAKLIECPFEVHVDAVLHDKFYDVRDAIASARAAKRNKRTSVVAVRDARTGRLVIEVED